MSESLLVMVGGAVGSLARYWLAVVAVQLLGPAFPFGTMLINIFGSFVLGLLVSLGGALALPPSARLLLGTGFCGGFTTFSTFSVESLTLVEKGDYALALLYVLGNLLGGLAGGWAGFVVARAL